MPRPKTGQRQRNPRDAQSKKAEVQRKQKAAKRAVARAVVADAENKSSGLFESLGGGLGSIAGGFLGGPAGAGIGKFLGGKLGHLASTITGFGDYTIEENSLLSGGMPVPQVVNTMDKGTTIVRHVEYLGDIESSIAFNIQTFNLNPGLINTFPWLAQTANSYEEYRFRGMIIEFRSTSSNSVLSSSASTALGSVIMATQYDVQDPVFVDKRSMLNHEYSNSCDPSKNAIHLVECKKSMNVLNNQYTRSGPVPTGADLHLYDLGKFSIATVGCQLDGGVIGELWISYEVELYKSQYNLLGFQDEFRSLSVTNTHPLGLTGAAFGPNSDSTLGGRIGATGAMDTYYFPPNVSNGVYRTLWAVSSAGATGPISYPTTIGINLAQSQTDYINSPAAANTSAQMMSFRDVKVTGPNAAMVFPSTSNLIPAGAGTFRVTYLGNNPDLAAPYDV